VAAITSPPHGNGPKSTLRKSSCWRVLLGSEAIVHDRHSA
jgi:hypothetical protein